MSKKIGSAIEIAREKLEQTILRLPESHLMREMFVEHGEIFTLDRSSIARRARKLDTSSKELKEIQKDLLAYDACYMAWCPIEEMARKGVVQLRNLAEVCNEKAWRFLTFVEQERKDISPEFRKFLEHEISIAFEVKKDRC